MTRPTISQDRPQSHLIRRIGIRAPIVVAVYAASSVALGFGFANPLIDAVGLMSTAGGFAIGDMSIRSVTSHLDGGLA